MMRLKLLYPFLFSILPILTVLTRNPGGSTLGDAAEMAVVMLLMCAIAYVLVLAMTGTRGLTPLASLIVLGAIIWFYAYEPLRGVYHLQRGPAAIAVTGAVLLVLVAASVAAVRWLARRPYYLDRVTTFFALTGTVLVAWSATRIVADRLAARSAVRHSHLAQTLASPIPENRAGASREGQLRRDIYVIILDEYANATVLKDRFGFDNHEFLDSLRSLGFTVPKLIRSNYVHTLLSIPSFLNFSYLTELGEELGRHNTDPTLPDYLVENNRTAAFLKAHGYKFLFFPSQWWISTGHNRNADWEFRAWTGFNPLREATRSDFRRAFISTTPLALLGKGDAFDAEHVRRTLAAVAEVPERKEPTFTLAHILNPHYPYVFGHDCQPVKHRFTRGWGQGREKAYLDQARCLNKVVLQTVTTLLQRSETQPIILLLGDHGTNSLHYSDAPTAAAVTPAQAQERFGAFGAFFLPGHGAGLLADSITLVNIIPTVLDRYLNAGIPLVPDHLYMSLERTPYAFVEVDPSSLSR
jgi:hypothetical protein